MDSNIPYIFKKTDLSLLAYPYLLANKAYVLILPKLLLAILLLSTPKVHSQVTLYSESVEARKGQVVDIPINITGFNDVLSMQFSLTWDSTVLAFKEIHSYTEALPQFGAEGVGTEDAESGTLIVVWFDNSVSGISVEDSTTLAQITFEVIGEEGSKSAIVFSDTPAIIEIVDANATVLEPELISGEIVVPSEMLTSTLEVQAQDGMRLFQNHPNPFNSSTTIQTVFTTSEWVTFTITDIQGKSVYRKQFRSTIGSNNILIQKDLLPTTGTYNYTIQSEAHQLTKQMILLP